jgi:2-C-methyl-D-erythritol 4-phosphate cytidylyltransferase
MSKNIALILAGGRGSRITSSIPKQYIEINGKPILVYTLEAFNDNPLIDSIYIVGDKNYFDLIEKYIIKFKITKFKGLIENGSSRQESSFNGLKELIKIYSPNDIVLIHDACRPLVSQRIIKENILECNLRSAVNTAVKPSDTIFIYEDNKVNSILNRDILKASQTPQTFKIQLIYDAHEKFKNESVTDDVQLVKKLGQEVYIVDGDPMNYKITTDLDLKLFETIKN